mgnify:CR=1 FL=1
MFNRDALFGKKDDAPRNEPRSSVTVTPGLGAITDSKLVESHSDDMGRSWSAQQVINGEHQWAERGIV